MSNMFYGVGDTYAKTKTAPVDGQNVIIPLYLFDFEYVEDTSPLEAKGMIKGVKRTLASAPGSVTTTVKLSTQLINWSQLGFFTNQFASVQSVVIPVLKTGHVPIAAPYEVQDDGIVAGNASGIYVYVSDENDPSYRKIVTAAPPPAVGEVKIDSAAHKLVFHSSDAGKPFSYTFPANNANKQSYGGAGGGKWGAIEFWGTVYGTEDIIHFPHLDFKTSPSFNFTGDVATLSVDFSANLSIGDGDIYPYRLYKK